MRSQQDAPHMHPVQAGQRRAAPPSQEARSNQVNAPRTMSAIIGVAESIAANWAMYEQVEAGLLPSPLHGTSYDGAGGHSSIERAF